ncbi:LysR family transcriptional regulator [Oligoflexaceae bacterium]|nr:LysR family transcriptional regulator [Oligoflexaceae bacterium]
MNIDHLKYFIDAAKHESVSKAAKLNFVGQPAVSRAIKGLEEVLGANLLVHGHNSFQLTETGQAIYAESFQVFDALSELKNLAEQFSDSFSGPLRLACNQSIATHLVAPAIVALERKHPKIVPQLKIGNTDQVQKMIDQREVDFGLVLNDGEIGKRYKTKNIIRDSFSVVHSPNYKERFEDSKLIISRSKKGGMSQKYSKIYKEKYGSQPDVKVEIASWEILKKLAILNYGYALVPSFICQNEIRSKTLKVHKHRVPPIKFSICTVVAKSRTLPRNAGVFLEAIDSL